MAQPRSKFAGLFANSPAAVAPDAVPGASRPVGRPPGKRSNPAWKQYSVLLRRDTQREAMLILRGGEGGQDFSGLVQTLLAEWVRVHRGGEA